MGRKKGAPNKPKVRAVNTTGLKHCTTCEGLKPLNDFHKSDANKDGFTGQCKDCRCRKEKERRKKPGVREAQSARHKVSRAKRADYYSRYNKNWKMIDRYGIGLKEWDALLISQSGRCWLCDQPMTGNRDPVVDHDHETNEIRGLAHKNCNSSFGLLNEDPRTIYALYEKAASIKEKREKTAQTTLQKGGDACQLS